MKPLIPAPRTQWTETSGREAVARRAAAGTGAPCCEVTGSAPDLHWSHRVAKGRGGDWAPSNGVLMSAQLHAWTHDHPAYAYSLGWHVRTGFDPREVPVWLARPWPGFWFLRDDEEPMSPAHPEDHPHLPTHDDVRALLPDWARGALL